MAFVFWDAETTGLSTDFDQILQFAAIRTDDNLNSADRLELRCRLHPHVVPGPGALRVTRMMIDRLTDPSLPCHYEMIRQIRAKLLTWAPAVFIGYNSLRYDEELLRKALFRTLHSPYLTNTEGNSRADALTLVQGASVFAPECLQVPIGHDGKPTFKLDKLAPLNGHDHADAHDAMGDVLATLHLARCVRDRAPEVWSRFLRFATKSSAAAFLEEEEAVVVTEFYGKKPYQYVVSAFDTDPGNPAAVLALDLKNDLDWVASLTPSQLETWVSRSPKPVRRIKTNAAPTLTAADEVPAEMLAPLDLETISARAARLRGDEALRGRLVAAVASAAREYEDSPHVEEQLYSGGFAPTSDQALMERFHEADWPERVVLVEQLEDARLRYHGRRLIHELCPELLLPEHRREIEDLMWERLLTEGAPKGKWTSLPGALAETDMLLAGCETDEEAVLTGLREHLVQRIAEGRSRT
jgi:exodeoxyribonuclease-1